MSDEKKSIREKFLGLIKNGDLEGFIGLHKEGHNITFRCFELLEQALKANQVPIAEYYIRECPQSLETHAPSNGLVLASGYNAKQAIDFILKLDKYERFDFANAITLASQFSNYGILEALINESMIKRKVIDMDRMKDLVDEKNLSVIKKVLLKDSEKNCKKEWIIDSL